MSAVDEQQTPPPPAASTAQGHDPYAVLRFRDFRLLLLGRFLETLGEQMLAVAVGWELYVRTHSAFALGLVGLVQIVPILLLSLPAGHLADRRDRRRIVVVSQALLALCSLGLAALSYGHGPLPLVYLCLFLIGVGLAFAVPASSTLLPQVVPAELFASAATWTSSSWQLAAVLGPALGGLVIALAGSATPVYLLNAAAAFGFVVLLLLIRGRQPVRIPSESTTFQALVEGFGFLRRTQVILATITLDLFAVLLGGAVTLLPVFATEVLHVGATGLGLMRAAPSAGAVLIALGMAHLRPFRRAGRAMLLAVAGFGAATVVFGLSRSFPLSLLMLAFLGAFDNVSVVVRSTLLLTRTPDALRGRVAAINSIFVGASNEVGGFESGIAAALVGPVIAVVAGGVGTLLVVAAVALRWPELRRLGRLSDHG